MLHVEALYWLHLTFNDNSESTLHLSIKTTLFHEYKISVQHAGPIFPDNVLTTVLYLVIIIPIDLYVWSR